MPMEGKLGGRWVAPRSARFSRPGAKEACSLNNDGEWVDEPKFTALEEVAGKNVCENSDPRSRLGERGGCATLPATVRKVFLRRDSQASASLLTWMGSRRFEAEQRGTRPGGMEERSEGVAGDVG